MRERFLQKPFIPEGKVTCVALDGRFNGENGRPNLKLILEKRGIRVISVPPCPFLSEPIAGHADMQFHPLGGKNLLIAPNAELELKKQLLAEGFTLIVGKTDLCPDYPADTPYNILRIGSLAFHNLKNTDPILREQLELRGVKFYSVKQGYAKCLTVILGENNILTEDQGIMKIAKKAGMKVYGIEKTGGIHLPPYNTGFLGGSSGLLAPKLLAFTGNINNHPLAKELKAYLHKTGMEYLFLASKSAWDVGSLIPLKEEGS